MYLPTEQTNDKPTGEEERGGAPRGGPHHRPDRYSNGKQSQMCSTILFPPFRSRAGRFTREANERFIARQVTNAALAGWPSQFVYSRVPTASWNT